MIEIVNKPYGKAFEKLAKEDSNILCLSGDLTSSCEIDGFRDRYPKQFISMGMAEQNMMSFAGGLGLAGFRPFHSYLWCVYLSAGPMINLVASIAYPRRKVTDYGFFARYHYSRGNDSSINRRYMQCHENNS